MSEAKLEQTQHSADTVDPADVAVGLSCVTQAPATGAFVLRFPRHVGKTLAHNAIVELARRLTACGKRSPILVDLSAVQTFDLVAPLVAIRAAAPVVPLMGYVDIIVSNALVRVAATSAARALGLNFTVRSPPL